MFISMLNLFFDMIGKVIIFIMNIQLQPDLYLWHVFFFLFGAQFFIRTFYGKGGS